jgi:hypothetical protein
MTNQSTIPSRPYPGRLYLALGLLLAGLGVLGYVLQLAMHRLTVPWYMPTLATIGVGCLVASLWQKRTVWRVLALLLVALLAGAQWTLLLSARLPAYTGPVAAGKPMPAFATLRADGTPFTQSDLEGTQHAVLVFFRGRW